MPGRPHLNPEVALRLIRSVRWHQDFEVLPGIRTQGESDAEGKWRKLALPADMTGLSLADVGASNGYFSFEARRRGARVVAFDIRHKDNSGFGLAQYLNGMEDIEHHQVNVLSFDPRVYGQFDIVLALGLLYHTADPYLALRRCAALATGRLFVESHCLDSFLPPELATEPLMRFSADTNRFVEPGPLGVSRGNFWNPTSSCLKKLIEDLGFQVLRVERFGHRALIEANGKGRSDSATRVNLAYGVMRAIPRGADPNDPAAWKIF